MPNSVAGTPSAWSQVATGLTNAGVAAGATQPFALRARSSSVNSTVNFQQLTVYLATKAGAAGSQTPAQSTYTFTALNSTVPAPSGICTFSGWRP